MLFQAAEVAQHTGELAGVAVLAVGLMKIVDKMVDRLGNSKHTITDLKLDNLTKVCENGFNRLEKSQERLGDRIEKVVDSTR